MKRLVVGIVMIALLFGLAVTTVSAETYEVKKGDNLWVIAEENDTTMEKLMEINDLDSTLIHPNQKIIINETYTVKKGDTLSAIGDKFDVSVKEIMDNNDLTSSLILIGQKLEIDPSKLEAKADKKSEKVTETKPKKEKAQKKQKEEPAAPVIKEENQAKKESSEKPAGKTISVKATAYTAQCDGCSGVTYTGVDLNKDRNAKVIAVDPNVIPLGSEVYVEGYGHAIAADIGGAIKGNRIDIHVPTKEEAYNWGVRNVEITVIK